MLAAFIGQRVLWLLIGQEGLVLYISSGNRPGFLLAQDFATCVSIKTMPTTLSEALAAS
jgi:hypothetical protein